MSVQFPLTTAPSDTASTATPLATLWRNVIPWDDLNAKELPDHWLGLGTDILPVLAIQATGAGVSGPRLLQSDAAGRLLASAAPYGFDVFLAAAGVGDTEFTPSDINLFVPGMSIMLINPLLTPPNIEPVRVQAIDNTVSPPKVVPELPLGQAYSAGMPIMILPATAISGYMPPHRPMTSFARSDPGNGVLADLIIPRVAGQIIVIDNLDVAVEASGAGQVFAVRARVWQDDAKTTLKWAQQMGVAQASYPVDRIEKQDWGLRCGRGTGARIDFDNTNPTVQLTINVGWFNENYGGGVTVL